MRGGPSNYRFPFLLLTHTLFLPPSLCILYTYSFLYLFSLPYYVCLSIPISLIPFSFLVPSLPPFVRRLACLKYLVLANMLMKSGINPFDSQEVRPRFMFIFPPVHLEYRITIMTLRLHAKSLKISRCEMHTKVWKPKVSSVNHLVPLILCAIYVYWGGGGGGGISRDLRILNLFTRKVCTCI